MHQIIIIAALLAISCNCPGKMPEVEAPPTKMIPKKEREIKPPQPAPEPKTKVIAINEIAFERDNATWLLNWEDKSEKKLVDGHIMAWLPDGHRLLYFLSYANNIAEIIMIDLRNMERRSIITTHLATDSYYDDLRELKEKEKHLFKGRPCDKPYFNSQDMHFGLYVRKASQCELPDPRFKGDLKNYLYLLHNWHGTTISVSNEWLAFDIWDSQNQSWDIYVYNLTTHEMNLMNIGANPVLSPDAKMLAYFENPDAKWIVVSKIDGSRRKKIAKGFYPTWLSDNRLLYYINQEVKKKILVASQSTFFGYNYQSDVGYKQFRGRLKIYYPGSNDHELVEEFCTFPPDSKMNRYFNPAAPSPTDDRLAIIGTRCTETWKHYVGIFDLNQYTFQKIKKSSWAHAPLYKSSWSPDGKLLAAPNLMKHRIDIIDITSQKVIMNLYDANNQYGWSWSPNSNYFIYEKDGISHYAYIPNRHIQMKLTDGWHALWCPATEREIQVQ